MFPFMLRFQEGLSTDLAYRHRGLVLPAPECLRRDEVHAGSLCFLRYAPIPHSTDWIHEWRVHCWTDGSCLFLRLSDHSEDSDPIVTSLLQINSFSVGCQVVVASLSFSSTLHLLLASPVQLRALGSALFSPHSVFLPMINLRTPQCLDLCLCQDWPWWSVPNFPPSFSLYDHKQWELFGTLKLIFLLLSST